MPDKKKLLKEFILNNPNLSGNELLKEARQKGLGIRKKEHYALVRETRNLPEPSIEKREKSIPIKYRDITIITTKVKIPKKEGQYGIVEVYDTDSKTSYWIKYTNQKDYNEQLDILQEKYQIVNMSIRFHGFNKYTEFIEQEFKEQLTLEGLSI